MNDISDNFSIKARTYESYLNLTEEQSAALKEFWAMVCDRLNNRPIKVKEEAEAPKSGSFSMWKLKGIMGGPSEDNSDLSVSSKSGEKLKVSLSKLIRCDHPDVRAVKYLIARKWKAKDSYKMFINSLDFFGEELHDQVRLEGERCLNANHLSHNECVYYKTCKDGRLILYVYIARNFASKYSYDENMKYVVNLMNDHYLMLGKYPSITVVFNMNGFSLANVDLSYLRMMTKMLSDHYPELLHRVLIHDAPWIFNSVWSAICTFLDPNIKAKIIFTQKDQLSDYIDEKTLLSDLGGADQVIFDYFPPSDKEGLATPKDPEYSKLVHEREDTLQKFIDSTYTWINSKSDSNKSQTTRNMLVDELAINHAKLSEYEYCSNIYHRLGVINEHDTINWKALNS